MRPTGGSRSEKQMAGYRLQVTVHRSRACPPDNVRDLSSDARNLLCAALFIMLKSALGLPMRDLEPENDV